MHVVINGKVYDGLDTLSTSKLVHLSFLAQVQIDNYLRCHRGANRHHQLKPSQQEHLERLKQNKAKIDALIAESRTS